MRFATAWTRRAASFAMPLVLAAAVACGGDDDKTTSTTGGGAGAVSGSATITMLDNKFEPANLTIKANQEASITTDNKGKELHNWHVLNVKGKDGKDITSTLIQGGKQETIKFTIDKAGTYDVQCDVHPADMRGKLTVQ